MKTFFQWWSSVVDYWRSQYYQKILLVSVFSDEISLGRRGEQYAALYLQSKGYKIIQRNWKNGQYELDIVAQKGDSLIFVEVKTRVSEDIQPPERNVNAEKQRRISVAAESFWKLNQLGLKLNKFRFDVIALVWPTGERQPSVVRHWENAFQMQTQKIFRRHPDRNNRFTIRIR